MGKSGGKLRDFILTNGDIADEKDPPTVTDNLRPIDSDS